MSGCRVYPEPLEITSKEVNVLNAMLWSKVFLGKIDTCKQMSLCGDRLNRDRSEWIRDVQNRKRGRYAHAVGSGGGQSTACSLR